MDAYLRLPEGWATTPAGLPTDQAMWHKFLRQPWCRAKFLRWPILCIFLRRTAKVDAREARRRVTALVGDHRVAGLCRAHLARPDARPGRSPAMPEPEGARTAPGGGRRTRPATGRSDRRRTKSRGGPDSRAGKSGRCAYGSCIGPGHGAAD